MSRFDLIRNNILKTKQAVFQFLDELQENVSGCENELLLQFIANHKEKLSEHLNALGDDARELFPTLERELSKKTQRLKKKIGELQRSKEAVASDNFFLEFKKKDLLQLTTDLESAYEEISEQAEQIKDANEKILEKNREMELQKESLLAQTDYLHEANETITQMHTELQKQREEILTKNVELLNLNNEKNNLIGIVAHDLKSPLNQIKGFINLIKLSTDKIDQETMELIQMIEVSTDRLSNMISKILDVEAIESRRSNLTMERTNLSEILTDVSRRFSNEAEEKKIVVNHNIINNLFAEVDKGYVDQVFQNLISNAIKFSPENRNVFVNLSSEDQKVICRIQDEGPGISEQDKKKLFGKYQKLSARPTAGETSTGLGLSIVKRFVEDMKGEIWCESTEGQGACFVVAFNRG